VTIGNCIILLWCQLDFLTVLTQQALHVRNRVDVHVELYKIRD